MAVFCTCLPAEEPGGRRVGLLSCHPRGHSWRASPSGGTSHCPEHSCRGESLRLSPPPLCCTWAVHKYASATQAAPARLPQTCAASPCPLPPAQLILNVNIRAGLVLTEITNPPAVTTYRVRLYSGPATGNTFVKYVQFTADQAKTVQPINLATLGLPAGTYSAGVMALGEHGWSAESARSNYVLVQARRSAARTVRPGRLLSEAQDAGAQAPLKAAPASGHTDARDEAMHKRHRNRHLL